MYPVIGSRDLPGFVSREQTTDPILAEFAVTVMTIGSPIVYVRL